MPFDEQKRANHREAAIAFVGWPGRMIGGSKSGYRTSYPANVPVFNANLCTLSAGKFWYGDLDLSRDLGSLKKLAARIEEDVYVLREMDCRFDTEAIPRFEVAICRIDPQQNVHAKNYKVVRGRLRELDYDSKS